MLALRTIRIFAAKIPSLFCGALLIPLSFALTSLLLLGKSVPDNSDPFHRRPLRPEMLTIRIPSETCLETAVPQMQAFWIRIRQRSQPLPVRGRIVGGSSHSCHWPLAISTVLPEVMTSCGTVISGEVCVGTSWLERPSRLQRASIPSASPCLMHLPLRASASETECPADHRSLATGIAPVRSSGIERVARRIERVSW